MLLDTYLMDPLRTAAYATPEDVIHLFVGGSELHGAKVGTTDADDLRLQAEEAARSSFLPDSIQQGPISVLVADTHRTYWDEHCGKEKA